MNKKDSLAILGTLFQMGYNVYYVGKFKHDSIENILERPEFTYDIIDYLRKLKLSYNFVKDILTDEYGSVFYHKEIGYNSERLPKKYNKEDLYKSEHDYQIWFTDTGRLGVWCEVDGFVAWLDEYKKVWVVDTRKEVAKRRKESEEWVEKNISPLIKKAFGKVEAEWKQTDPDELLKEYQKIEPFKPDGLPDYKKKGDK